jgi:NhaP-type Na+/H+ or K+/H+ antiporter
MDISAAIIFLGAIVILSHVFTSFFDRIKIPNVLLLMIIGILIGPVSGFVGTDDFGKVGPIFSNLVLLFILFESGTNLKLRELKKTIINSSLLTLIIFVGSTALIGAISHFAFDLNWIAALMVGSILGGSSSAIVIPMIHQIKLREESRSLLSMESALSDVLCLICGIGLFMAMKTGRLDTLDITKEIGVNFIISFLIGIGSGILWTIIIGRIRKVENSIFITAAYLFIVYGTTEYLKFNGGIAALILGVTLGNIGSFSGFFTKYLKVHTEPINSHEKKFFAELVFIFATYFFVYVGLSMQFSDGYFYLIAGIIVAALIIYRFLIVYVLLHKKELKTDRKFIFAVAPKGLVPAILASQPLEAGLESGRDILYLTYSIIFLTIIASSILVFVIQSRMGDENNDEITAGT